MLSNSPIVIRPRVLVIGDHPSCMLHQSAQLTELGYEVVASVDSGVASSSEFSHQADIALVDVGTGVCAIGELLCALIERSPSIAIVLVLRDAMLPASASELVSAGVSGLLAADATPEIVDATLRLRLARAAELAKAREEATEMRQQLENRKTIERAKGLLMRRTGTSEQEAYRILQRTSQDRSRPMVEVARAVLDSEPGVRAAS